MERMNQELEQYLRFFVNYRQKDWLEWLVLAEFVINNKTYLTTKVSLFMANYRRELRMGIDLRRKKNGKSNGVCKKDEKGTERSRGSIDKSTERNEETSG